MSLIAGSIEHTQRKGHRLWLILAVALVTLLAVAVTAARSQDSGSNEKDDNDSETVEPVSSQPQPEQAEEQKDEEEDENKKKAKQPPEIDDGLTEEERAFLSKRRNSLSDKEKKRWDSIAKKRWEHYKKNRQKWLQEKEKSRKPIDAGKVDPKTRGRKPPLKEEPLGLTPIVSGPDKPQPPAKSEELQLPEDNFSLPWHQRKYHIVLQNRPYDELVTIFARKAGLDVLGVPVQLVGEAPVGTLSYLSAEPADFWSTLHEINDRLYNQIKPPLYLYLKRDSDDHERARLELNAFKELRLRMPSERLFTSLEAVQEAGLRGSDIVRVFFAPETAAAMKLFDQLVSTLLDDFTLAVLDSNSGRIDFTGRLDMLNKMLDYMERLKGMTSGASIKRIPVKYLKPSQALEKLSVLVENVVSHVSGPAPRPPRKSKRRSRTDEVTLSTESEKIVVIPDDAHSSLLVTGLPYKVHEVEEVLKIIDIPEPEDVELPPMPVVVRLLHTQAEEAADILNRVINDSTALPRPKGRKRKKDRPTPELKEDINYLGIIAEPRSNSLILQGREELIEYAQEFIREYIDIPGDESNFRRVEIVSRDPQEVADAVNSLIGQKKATKGDKPFKIIVSGNAVIVTGEPAQMAQAEQIIKQLDVADDDKPTTFIIELEKAKPSFVVKIVEAALSSQTGGPKPPKKRRDRRAAGRLFDDDVNGIVYFTGTKREWDNDVLPIIQKLESSARPSITTGELIPVLNADTNVVVSTLNNLFGGPKPRKPDGQAGPKFAETPVGIIVRGEISTGDMENIRETVALLDVDPDSLRDSEQKVFFLEHADPAAVEKAVKAFFDGRARRPKKGAQAARDLIRTAVTARGIIVVAPKGKMPQVAELIEQMDQPAPFDAVVLKNYHLEHGKVDEVAPRLETLLKTKLNELMQEGAGKKGRRGGQPQNMLSVEAYPHSDSILVSSPQPILDYADEIIAELDVAAKQVGEKYVDYYDCVNASAQDLADTLNAIFAEGTVPSTKPPAKGVRGKKKRDRPRRRPREPGKEESEIEIIPLSGDKAIMVTAPSRDELEAVLARASEIDEKSTATDKMLRRFNLFFADVDEVAKAIIDILDKPRKGRARPKEEDMWGFDFEVGTQVGEEITVTPIYEAGALIVYAPPAKMEAVEALINEFEEMANPNLDEGVVGTAEMFETYTPKYLSAFEIVSLADELLYEVYDGKAPASLVFIDEQTILIKGRPRYFAEVVGLIEKHVDTPERGGNRDRGDIKIMRVPAHIPRDQLLLMITNRMPDVEIEIQDLSSLADDGEELVPEIK